MLTHKINDILKALLRKRKISDVNSHKEAYHEKSYNQNRYDCSGNSVSSRSHSKCSSIFCRSRRCTCRRTELTDLYSNQRRNPVEISWQQHRPCWRSGFADLLDWKRIWWHNMENSLRKVRCQTRCSYFFWRFYTNHFTSAVHRRNCNWYPDIFLPYNLQRQQSGTTDIYHRNIISRWCSCRIYQWTSGKIGRYANKYSEQ